MKEYLKKDIFFGFSPFFIVVCERQISKIFHKPMNARKSAHLNIAQIAASSNEIIYICGAQHMMPQNIPPHPSRKACKHRKSYILPSFA